MVLVEGVLMWLRVQREQQVKDTKGEMTGVWRLVMVGVAVELAKLDSILQAVAERLGAVQAEQV
jgi:hypothetical protein